MKQNVLDGVVAIEAKAAKMVDEAKARARQAREQVKADLDTLSRQLDEQAKSRMADYQAKADEARDTALAGLDRQAADARQAIEKVRAESVPPLVGELLRLLEQRSDGD